MTTGQANALDIVRERGWRDDVSVAIVLGTGLVRLADEVANPISIPYRDLPGFPETTVSGHEGRLVLGVLGGVRVALMQGRAHFYETGDPRAMWGALETLKALGASTLILTNAAGSLHPDWPPGTLALISDHINLSGANPLIGVRGDRRFVSMVDAYDPRLRRKFKLMANFSNVHLNEGVYMWFGGPTFETPAEIRMAKTLGADLVGMSTVPETMIARHLGFDVAALSVVTNLGAGIMGARPSHGETKDVAISGSVQLKRLLVNFLKSLDAP